MSAVIQARQDNADRVIDAAIEHSIHSASPLTIVQSPPGAGKTYLVECAIALAATRVSMRTLIVTPGVSQLYDIARRLLEYDLPRVELVHATHRSLPNDLQGRIAASNGWAQGLNSGPGVLVANAHVLSANIQKLPSHSFDLMIVDEAYQLSASDFLPLAALAPRVLMVGDPGQLDPVVSTDTTNFEAAAHKVHWSVPAYILDRFPDTPVFGLPVTRRLLPDSAALVQQSFYPDLPFTSVVDPADRQLRFGLAGVERGIDDALDAMAAGKSLVALTIPGRPPAHEEADPAVAHVMARVADRILTRQAEWVGVRRLTESDIGCIDPHVISGGAISDRLRQSRLAGVRVDTVERWQGLQLPISIVRHPLSVPTKPVAFDLEAGRWCVSLSRHQIGCLVVARESVQDKISNYVHGCDTVAAGAQDVTWSGYEAHRHIWTSLIRDRRVFSI